MFKQIKKKKKTKTNALVIPGEQITCGACSYVRQDADHHPHWQCPACKSAYSKVNKKAPGRIEPGQYSQTELREKNWEYLREKEKREKEEKLEQQQVKEQLGKSAEAVRVGALAYVSGMGSACMAANPVVQAVGVAIIIGAVIYALLRVFG